ncbi:MAG TPA: carotenoid oxygenase family protein [Acidimicrobiia bacterium]|jgi:carotenoid cleavage dioxygenase|nr:carotenoid oxygenase family protein [Acidimicrobiia bacterium]
MVATTNPFLLGNYAPVRDEVTDSRLEVRGALPRELSGRYLRIGPNPYAMPEGPYHWFIGDGMVHGIELRDGRANWYRNRWVRTAPITGATGEAAIDGPPPPMYDSSNTNVIGHAGRVLSLTEGAMPYELSPELDTLRRTAFDGTLPTGFTAHPKTDPVTGELHGFAYSWTSPNLIYHVIDASGRLVRSEPITVGGPTMIHDFALTRSSVVFFDLPVVFDLSMVERGLAMPYRWDDDYPARVGVMPRDGGDADVVWSDVEPCYVFHPMNAYDEGDAVVVDVCRHPTMFAHSVEGPNDGGLPTLDRWTIDTAARKVRQERLDDRGQEFPRVNESLLMSRHRYGYVVETINSETAFDTARILKHDLQTGTSEGHDFANGGSPGEFVFVPSEGATSEDDGYLMGFVYDPTRDSSDFVVLDASAVASEPIATVALPQRVPYGFHGNWVPDPR